VSSARDLIKAVPLLLFLGLLVGLFPVTVWITDPLATHAWDPRLDTKVLLLWPDHIELRSISTLSEFSPRPLNAEYTFMVPTERMEWVKERLREAPNPNASWMIRVKTIGPVKQEVRLESMGDGYFGMIYEATPTNILPMRTRIAGPGFAFVILWVHLTICTALFFLCRWMVKLAYRRSVESKVVNIPPTDSILGS
jgi:hypothetical protein